jgi:GntR family transcriptional regulator
MSLHSQSAPFRLRLSLESGVPVYRQIVDQVRVAMAAGLLSAGDQLPTVRQLAVDLTVNPNTVARAYRELELGGLLDTHQGTGSFISAQKIRRADAERERQLAQIVDDCVARAGALGFTVEEIAESLRKTAGTREQPPPKLGEQSTTRSKK